MQATDIIKISLPATLKVKKKMIKVKLILMFYLTQYIQNIMSHIIAIKLLMIYFAKSEIWCVFYIYSTSHFTLVTFQVFISHMWLVATVSDSIRLD